MIRTWLDGWICVLQLCMLINLTEEDDIFRINFHQSGQFSVRSMYMALINGHIERNKFIWKLNMPLKIKIFMWYLLKGIVLTKDNLARRNWNGSLRCCFLWKMNRFTIFSRIAILPDLFGDIYNSRLDYTLHIVYLICLGIGLWVLIKRSRNLFLLELPLYVGLSGLVEMKWFLIDHLQNLICRFFPGQHSGSGNRLNYKGMMIISN